MFLYAKYTLWLAECGESGTASRGLEAEAAAAAAAAAAGWSTAFGLSVNVAERADDDSRAVCFGPAREADVEVCRVARGAADDGRGILSLPHTRKHFQSVYSIESKSKVFIWGSL